MSTGKKAPSKKALLVGLAVAEPLADLLPDARLTVIPRAPHATNY